jgi:two-component system nitrogen regulation response regulator NtrX
MSLDTQAKVLRVLQEQEFERVGGIRTIKVDVRIITATNKDLPSLVEKGSFREDLYYRLNVIPFHIPPLRERKDDIPPLVDYFFDSFAKDYGKSKRTVTPGAMELFMAHPWPGNIRELKNMIERIIIMIPDEELSYERLEEIFIQTRIPFRREREFAGELTDEDLSSIDDIMSKGSYKDSVANFEKLLLEKRLKANSWNVTKTAKELGLERSHLHKKVKLFGIEKSR